MFNIIFNQSDYEIAQKKMETFEKFNKVIQWGRREPVKFMEKFLGLEFTDHQKYVLLSTWNARIAVWLMSRNSGKASHLDTPIYIKDSNKGFCKKTIGELKVGDFIYGDDGKLTEVIHLNPIIFDYVYIVEFEDGEKIECNADHLWNIYDINKNIIIKDTFWIYKHINKDIIRIPSVDSVFSGITGQKKIISVIRTTEKKPMRCITVSNKSGSFLCGNNMTITHNSYLASPYMMARSILIPNNSSYIMCPAGNQAQETFSKIEKLAKGQISSIAGSTSVFLQELIKNNAGDDGFVHDKNSHYCELYNGSSIHTLNSVAKNIVGIRSNLNFYDEAGKIDREFFALTKPFCTQDTNFITGGNINIQCYPKQLYNQIIYASSAESIDSELFDAYKDAALRMIAGDDTYFVCDITCELSLHPKLNGKGYRPLISQEIVDDAMRKNEFKANREYFNKFDLSGGQDALVKRTTILAHSLAYEPIFENIDNTRTFIITWDPSTKLDNSMVLVGELLYDEEQGYMIKIVNARNLIDRVGKEKKVKQKPEQVECVKSMILDYNGKVPDYENLEQLIIDAGSGGGGFETAQYLLRDWKDKNKKNHIGFIDINDKYMVKEKDKFPSACRKLTLANFTANKVDMYLACQDMINQGKVIFPKSLNFKGEMEFEEVGADGNIVVTPVRMNSREVEALTEIDMLKEELIATQKLVLQNGVKFDILSSKKLENMHDDRVDCCAMMCYYLYQLRKSDLLKVENKNSGFKDYFKHIKNNKINNTSPFSNDKNPFSDMKSNPFQ